MAQLGYLGIRYPATYGGSEGDNVMFELMCEELARGSMSIAANVSMQCLMDADFVFRDARVLLLGGGTSEVLRRIIARHVGL